MDIATSKAGANSGSSGGSSSASSFVDLKTSEKRIYDSRGIALSTKSRSFLQCLSKQLGRHLPHQQQHQGQSQNQNQKQHQNSRHHHHQPQQNSQRPGKCERIHNVLAIYNSEDDIHSSSTDSFSLSYERCSTHTPSCPMTGSSVDLTGEDRSSGTSSAASAYSRFSSAVFASDADEIWPKQHARRHFFVEAMYRRPVSALGQLTTDEYSNDSPIDVENDNESNEDNNDHDKYDDEDEDDDHSNDNANDRRKKSVEVKCNSKINGNASPLFCSHSQSQSRSRSISPCSITKGLHLSRISITSSVCRMFQHFTTSSSATTSTRSLSCSSTPLHGSKKSVNNANGSQAKTSNEKSTPNASDAMKKKDKKQQSILRPPVHYVYMKGMSGLYSRVPRYTVCCPYTSQTA